MAISRAISRGSVPVSSESVTEGVVFFTRLTVMSVWGGARMSAVKVLLHVRCSDLGFVKRLPEMCLVARPLGRGGRRERGGEGGRGGREQGREGGEGGREEGGRREGGREGGAGREEGRGGREGGNAHNRRSRAFFDWFVDGALPKDGPSLRWWCSFRNDGRPSPPQCSQPAARQWSFGDSSHSRSGFVDIRARAGENAKVRFQKPRKRMGSRKRNRRGLSRPEAPRVGVGNRLPRIVHF